MNWLKRLFHVHQWQRVRAFWLTATNDDTGERERIPARIEQCETCGARRAYATREGASHIPLDLAWVEDYAELHRVPLSPESKP